MNLYEKVKSHCKHTKRRLNQHGQALVLYVIAFPLLFMFVCAGIDIGWYYLNVSRLKNAAEAAAIAGANTLAKYDNTTEDISIENIKKILLVNEYAGETDTTVNLNAANTSAVYYANKNLSDTAESADAADTETPAAIGIITNSWTHSLVTLVMEKDVNDPKKESFTTLFKDTNENIYYYRVTLKEDVAHFMMPGWFNDMPAIVDAVVKLSVGGTGDVPDLPDWNDGKITPEEKEVLEEIKNGNVIVGNWEVQAYYIGARDITAISNTFTTSDKITEIKGRMTTFLNGFGYAFYHEAWNLFSDEIMHYKEGDLYRTENVNIWDDVTGFGSGQFGNGGSSVLKTNAAKNILDKTSYTYNSGGYPYMAKDLDSIDVDFVPDAGFYNSEEYYRFQNWDLQLGYGNASIRYVNKDTTYNTHPFIGVGTIKTTQQNGGQNYAAWPDHLRSHATLNFGNPYPERARYEKTHPKDRDILWTRIESEPMLSSPDNPEDATSTDPKNVPSNLEGATGMKVLSSVRQIIITFTKPNTGSNDRPLVIFYDGPEMYKNLPNNVFADEPQYQNLPNAILREFKPVIINLEADTNAMIYMPNNPVVFLPNGHRFNGFIVAKSYLRLKTEDDFRNENVNDYYEELNVNGYYKKLLGESSPYYSQFKDSPGFRRTEAVKNSYSHTITREVTNSDNELVNKTIRTGEPEMINWMYTKIINPANGIEMYVDDYGNVQYVEDADSKTPRNSGTYNTFGRTHFTTHNYKIPKTAKYNLMVMTEN